MSPQAEPLVRLPRGVLANPCTCIRPFCSPSLCPRCPGGAGPRHLSLASYQAAQRTLPRGVRALVHFPPTFNRLSWAPRDILCKWPHVARQTWFIEGIFQLAVPWILSSGEPAAVS